MRRARGFTLLEVLVAMAILAGAMFLVGNSWSGNFMRIRKTSLYNDAATLLERKMAEVEAKYKDKPISEVPEDDGGEFEGYPDYRWEMRTKELEFPDLTPMLVGQDDGAPEMLITMIKQMTEYISKTVKEVKVSIFVKRGGKEIEYAATQYFVDYTQNFAGGGAAPDAGTSGDTGGGP